MSLSDVVLDDRYHCVFCGGGDPTPEQIKELQEHPDWRLGHLTCDLIKSQEKDAEGHVAVKAGAGTNSNKYALIKFNPKDYKAKLTKLDNQYIVFIGRNSRNNTPETTQLALRLHLFPNGKTSFCGVVYKPPNKGMPGNAFMSKPTLVKPSEFTAAFFETKGFGSVCQSCLQSGKIDIEIQEAMKLE